jgi:uncharacterized protein YdeI (YjbR/CyaY-like superfamily)
MENTDTIAGLPVLLFATQQEWEAWLAEHHADSQGIWVKLAKKNGGVATVTYLEALDSALCYGWIDGQVKAHDAACYMQRFTPRRPKSAWSKINTEKVAQLEAAGRMRPAGLRAVELARRDGRWDAAYASQSTQTVPDDLQRELDAHPAAREFFETLDKLNRYAICRRIDMTVRPQTRRANIDKYVGMLERHEKPYP